MISEIAQQNSSRFWLEGVVESFEAKMATIITKDGQKLLWPIENLPVSCLVGSSVKLILSTDESDSDEQQQIAKKILNEILKNND